MKNVTGILFSLVLILFACILSSLPQVLQIGKEMTLPSWGFIFFAGPLRYILRKHEDAVVISISFGLAFAILLHTILIS
jgi:hypothetical protein